MIQKDSVEKLYIKQNIQYRKWIRNLDWDILDKLNQGTQTTNKSMKDLNILLVGPCETGKTQLIKTMFYALNGNTSFKKDSTYDKNMIYDKYNIKKGRRSLVKGTKTMKQTDQTFSITAIEIKSLCENKSLCQKYLKVCQLLTPKLYQYYKQLCFDKSQQKLEINHILICLSMVQKIGRDQLVGLKYLISLLQQRNFNFTIIGTKVDLVLDRQDDPYKQVYIQQWKKYLCKELNLKNANEIYCIQNYYTFRSDLFVNKECINFYGLRLLKKIINSKDSNQLKSVKSHKSFLFCCQ